MGPGGREASEDSRSKVGRGGIQAGPGVPLHWEQSPGRGRQPGRRWRIQEGSVPRGEIGNPLATSSAPPWNQSLRGEVMGMLRIQPPAASFPEGLPSPPFEGQAGRQAVELVLLPFLGNWSVDGAMIGALRGSCFPSAACLPPCGAPLPSRLGVARRGEDSGSPAPTAHWQRRPPPRARPSPPHGTAGERGGACVRAMGHHPLYGGSPRSGGSGLDRGEASKHTEVAFPRV